MSSQSPLLGRTSRSDSEEGVPGPIVFETRDLKPNMQIKVFGTTFHVNSEVLRLHSTFFRKFLDSADKVPAPAFTRFLYQYVSVVDEDGEWGLEVAKNVCKSPLLGIYCYITLDEASTSILMIANILLGHRGCSSIQTSGAPE